MQAEEQAEELAQSLAKSNEAQRKANSNYSDWRKRITVNREATVPEEEVRSYVCMHLCYALLLRKIFACINAELHSSRAEPSDSSHRSDSERYHFNLIVILTTVRC